MGSGLKDQESNPGQKPLFESRGPAFCAQSGGIYRRKCLTSTRTPDTRMTVVWQSQTPSNYILYIIYYILYIIYYISADPTGVGVLEQLRYPVTGLPVPGGLGSKGKGECAGPQF